MRNPYQIPQRRFGMGGPSVGPPSTPPGTGNAAFAVNATLTASATVSPTTVDTLISVPLLGTRQVWSHYFTPFQPTNTPTAQDWYTVNGLAPWGEKGKWTYCGGYIRDRPVVLPHFYTSGDVMLQIEEYEINQAHAGGLTGFTVDMLSSDPNNYNYQRYMKLMDAASAVSFPFKIVPMPDCNSLNGHPDTEIINAIVAMIRKSSIFRLTDRRPLIAPFHAEYWTIARWQTVLAGVEAQVGSVAFWPLFLGYTSNVGPFKAAFPQQMVGAAVWGGGNPKGSAGDAGYAKDAHARGLMWMQPIHFLDQRPKVGTYDEACNTQTLRDTWNTAITTGSEAVQYVTWGDYSEAPMAPSTNHGTSVLDLGAYYVHQWRTGTAPPITTDTIYLSHRKQKIATAPVGWTNPDGSHQTQTMLMTQRANSTTPRDTVEALVFLTAPATVRITVAGVNYDTAASAGITSVLAPLQNGSISARVIRSGQADLVLTSAWAVTGSPQVQDMQYVMSSVSR